MLSKISNRLFNFAFLLLLTRVFYADSVVLSQDSQVAVEGQTTESAKANPSPENIDLQKRSTNLNTIIDTIKRLEKERSAIQNNLSSASAKGREAELFANIEDLSKQISNLEEDFIEVASGVKLSTKSTAENDLQKDLTTELYILLKPLLKELQDLTSRPREIDQLKSSLVIAQRDINTIENGLEQIDSLLKFSSGSLGKRLKNLKTKWTDDLDIHRAQEEVLRDKLKKIIDSQRTLAQTLSDLSNLFFKSRGKNLFLALLASVLFGLGLKKLRLYLEKKWGFQRYNFRKRFIFVSIWLASIVGSLLLFLLVLFFLGDWVLVVISVSIILGVLWAIKHFIPIFWAQAVLLLNMGAVREGERVKYRGVLWLVKRLHIYVTLENALLSEKILRVPLKDFTELRS